jgi:hypothetical protein
MTIDKTTQNQSLHNIEDCLACEGLPKRFNGSGLYVECKKYHPTSETEKRCVWLTVIEKDLEKLERGDYNVTFSELEKYRV